MRSIISIGLTVVVYRSDRMPRQAEAMGISHTSLHYLSRPGSPEGLALLRRIDERHLKLPFAGSQILCGPLNAQSLASGRKHIAALMEE